MGADPNRRNYWLWGASGIAGSNLLANGVSVSLNPVPTTAAGWTNAPYEAQYLKLYDVTPPASLAAPTTTGAYVIGNTVTFNWLPLNDPDGGVSGYQVMVGTSPGASDVFNGIVQGTTLDGDECLWRDALRGSECDQQRRRYQGLPAPAVPACFYSTLTQSRASSV